LCGCCWQLAVLQLLQQKLCIARRLHASTALSPLGLPDRQCCFHVLSCLGCFSGNFSCIHHWSFILTRTKSYHYLSTWTSHARMVVHLAMLWSQPCLNQGAHAVHSQADLCTALPTTPCVSDMAHSMCHTLSLAHGFHALDQVLRQGRYTSHVASNPPTNSQHACVALALPIYPSQSATTPLIGACFLLQAFLPPTVCTCCGRAQACCRSRSNSISTCAGYSIH
jgi:hypothetical protein